MWQVDHTALLLAPVGAHAPLHQCDQCRRLHPVSVRGVCPTLDCAGTLHPFTPPAPEADDDHYRALYRSLNPVPLRAQEHTAQWSSRGGRPASSRTSSRGEVNVLSCSTTFELGVDVGELQAVVLRNMPPTTANYVQRAGRAGRRTDSAALVVTYAQRRSHDLSRFAGARAMIAGQVRAPYVPLDNARIDRRHAHSVALAAFFRRLARRHRGGLDAPPGTFFLPGGDGAAAPVHAAVRRLPHPGAERGQAPRCGAFCRPTWPPTIGVDRRPVGRRAVRLLEQVRARSSTRTSPTSSSAARQPSQTDATTCWPSGSAKTINTIVRRPLIGFLATRNVLPKYGFPVDTVELRTAPCRRAGRAADWSWPATSPSRSTSTPRARRSSRAAEVDSGGVYRLPGRELRRFYYRVCDACGYYAESDGTARRSLRGLRDRSRRHAHEYCVPEFGFVADCPRRKPRA